MELFGYAMGAIGALLSIWVGALSWWNARLVKRLDDQATLLADLKTSHQVHRTETTTLLNESRLREVLKDELKSISEQIDKSQGQIEARLGSKRERLERLEARVGRLETQREIDAARHHE